LLDSGWFYDAEYQWGFASSPVIHGEHVFVQCDIQKNSFLAAFRLNDGAEIWRSSRDELPTWSTPTVCDTSAGPIIVTNGTNRVRGYDARSGEQLWELSGNSEIAVPTPQFAYQTIFVTSGYRPIQPIYAISPDARGDISLKDDALTSESIKWSLRRNGPYLPTPIVYRGFLYTLDNSGVVTCYEALSGKQVYRERIKGFGSLSFVASPVAADGNIFLTAEGGQVIVIKGGPKFETLHSNPTGESVLATPAMSQGMFLIRSQSHLISVGRKEVDNEIQH
jgi:outer membrane protein assembly factor BamB